MKKILFLSLIISLIIVSCTQQKVKSPLEGAWRCVYMGGPVSTDTSLQAMIKEGQIKMFSKEYFSFVAHFENKLDTGVYVYEGYGAGTYKLNGDKYEETIIYHNQKDLVGKKYKAIDKIRNDTLFHTATDDNWKINENIANEIYVRLK
jgi:hypothetical protein